MRNGGLSDASGRPWIATRRTPPPPQTQKPANAGFVVCGARDRADCLSRVGDSKGPEGRQHRGRAAAGLLPTYQGGQFHRPARSLHDGASVLVARGALLAIAPLGLHRLAQVAVELGLALPQVLDDLEILFLHAAEVELLDVDQPQQLLHRLRHLPPALVTRTPALRHADPRPEVLLVQAELAPNLFWIDREIEDLHLAVVPFSMGSPGSA